MVLRKMIRLLRLKAPVKTPSPRTKGRVARWVGRHLAHWTYATTVEPTWLEVNQLEIPIAQLPECFVGMKLVQMTDFHCGQQVTSDYLREAVDLAMAQKGDAVVLTGDFIHKGDRHVTRVAQALGRLQAPLGVFAVLGNHDFSVRNALGFRKYRNLHQKVADALTAHGITVLRNEAVHFQRNHESLTLAGIEDLWSRECDPDASFAGLPDKTPRIVLAHNPLTIELLNGHRCDLMLSGHTHGGQILLPGLGRLALSPKGRRFAAGLYQVGHGYLYVNKGIGFGVRIRYRVRPEVAVFTLIRKV